MKNYLIIYFVLASLVFSCKSDSNTNIGSGKDEPVAMDSVYQFVEELPRFPGCENKSSREELKLCSDSLLLKYIYANVKYPQYAIEHNIQGRCVISFIVEKDGSISNSKIAKDIGGGCGEAALTVINSMNSMTQKWTPGKNNGESKRVLFNLPVSFRLENKNVE